MQLSQFLDGSDQPGYPSKGLPLQTGKDWFWLKADQAKKNNIKIKNILFESIGPIFKN